MEFTLAVYRRRKYSPSILSLDFAPRDHALVLNRTIKATVETLIAEPGVRRRGLLHRDVGVRNRTIRILHSPESPLRFHQNTYIYQIATSCGSNADRAWVMIAIPAKRSLQPTASSSPLERYIT